MNLERKYCIICLEKGRDNLGYETLVELSTQGSSCKTYLDKIQFIMNCEIVIYECSLICNYCISELDKAYEFRERVVKALDYWSSNYNTSMKSNGQNKQSDMHFFSDSDNNESECTVNNITVLTDDVIREEICCENTASSEAFTIFICNKCETNFLTASELLHHHCTTSQDCKDSNKTIKVKKKTYSASFTCDYCDESFNKRWRLNKHIKTYHSYEKKFVCTYCDRAFKQSYHLREHLTSHTGERNFSCNICGKTFQRMSSQRRHMKSHEAVPGEKSKKSPFLCTICGKSFPFSNGAQRHMRIHSGDRRFECKVCGNKFSQSTHLRVHLRTHTGERPYVCTGCGDSFSLKATLQKHMKRHKKKNDVEIVPNLEPNLSQSGTFVEKEDQEDSDKIDFNEEEFEHEIKDASLLS